MTTSSKRNLLLVFLALISLNLQPCQSKVVKGSFKLSGVTTEAFLQKFAFSAGAMGRGEVLFFPKGSYPNPLYLYLYSSEEWPKVKRAPTCQEKVRYARRKWQIRLIGTSTQHLSLEIDNTSFKSPRYWYVTVADCSLEEYFQDNIIPEMEFNIALFDQPDSSRPADVQIPADEQGMRALHTFNCIFSALLAVVLVTTATYRITSKREVHISLFLIFSACLCHGLSSAFEILHISFYAVNGYGLYWSDAMSAYMEAVCDTVIALLLLSLAGGWTLPSDIKTHTSSSDDAALSEAKRSLVTTLKSFSTTRNPTYVLFLSLFIVHEVLAQWGRMYSDDFDCYHDLEHLPGRILFLFRILMGCQFLYNTALIRRSTHCSVSLRRFYQLFSLIGGMWFIFLSGLAWWTSTLIPVYRRHEVVSGGAALGQAMALACLTWLFIGGVGDSSFHKVSKVAAGDVDGIDSVGTDSGKRGCWKIGKVKVRVD